MTPELRTAPPGSMTVYSHSHPGAGDEKMLQTTAFTEPAATTPRNGPCSTPGCGIESAIRSCSTPDTSVTMTKALLFCVAPTNTRPSNAVPTSVGSPAIGAMAKSTPFVSKILSSGTGVAGGQ